MSTSRFALFVDLENCGAKVATLNNILEKVKIRGDILLGKVYGYTDQFKDLKEILLSNTFTVVPSLRYGISQKNNADILLVIDALEVAYTNPLIDSFCIVSGDSDYTPLVGRLKSMGKFVLGISRSEVASSIFINVVGPTTRASSPVTPRMARAVSSVSRDKRRSQKQSKDEPLDDAGVNKLLEGILSEQTDEDEMYASELKGVLLRLRPDFNEKAFGCASFGKLLNKLATKFGTIRVKNDNYNVLVSLNADAPDSPGKKQLTPDSWRAAFAEQLQHYKDDGFERINPSILKADIQAAYPDFTERAIGFKRFSDVLKQMEKDGLLRLEMDGQKNMLIKML